MLSGIKEILIISTPRDLPRYKNLLGDESSLRIRFKYAIQKKPNGLAEAFIIGDDFISTDKVALILRDNISTAIDSQKSLKEPKLYEGAVIFGYYTNNPETFGIVEFDSEGNVLSIEEKPRKTKIKLYHSGTIFLRQ